MTPVSTADYRQIAQRRLPPFLFEYVDGGSFGEVTLGRNVSDLQEVALRQRVLVNMTGVDLSTELFGRRLAMPVILGPVGLAGMFARRGECQAARAAAEAGIPFTLSTVSACSLDEVSANTAQPIWFQLYMMKDRGFMREMLAKAADLGCPALVFTVDMAAPGVRYRAFHSGLAGASGMRGQIWRAMQGMMHPRWAWDVGVRGRPHSLGNIGPQLGRQSGIDDFFRWIRENFDSSIGWKDLEEVREVWKGPLVLKGILDVEDARQAADLGADGIVVSNHGGRQLDGVPSTARALPAIADAVGDRLSVLADGGVRSGLDVVRMIALGAKAVMLGRAWAYALGAGGEAYVRRLIGQFESEIRSAMILTGTQSVTEIDRSRLVMQPQGRNQPW